MKNNADLLHRCLVCSLFLNLANALFESSSYSTNGTICAGRPPMACQSIVPGHDHERTRIPFSQYWALKLRLTAPGEDGQSGDGDDQSGQTCCRGSCGAAVSTV